MFAKYRHSGAFRNGVCVYKWDAKIAANESAIFVTEMAGTWIVWNA